MHDLDAHREACTSGDLHQGIKAELADTTAQEIVETKRGRRERLDAGERKQLLCQFCPALHRRQNLIEPFDHVIVADASANEVEVASYDHQKIVEVVSQSAGQLAHDLHLLCLVQERFGALAYRDLVQPPAAAA